MVASGTRQAGHDATRVRGTQVPGANSVAAAPRGRRAASGVAWPRLARRRRASRRARAGRARAVTLRRYNRANRRSPERPSRGRSRPSKEPSPMADTLVPGATATAERAHKAPKRYIYAWGGGRAEGNAQMRDLLGGKGAGLAEMTTAGLPVPPGFTITTEACNDYFASGEKLPDGLWDDVLEAVKEVERETGKGFGDARNPLLVSVRSGAKFSMPGMMDTVLNLGLNEETLQGLVSLTGNERFGWDAYRRFVQMFGRIVMDVPGESFDHALDAKKAERGASQDTDLDAAALRELVHEFKGIVRRETGRDFPTDPYEQLDLAIKAVFRSWFGQRARDYRRFNKIPDDLRTAGQVVTEGFWQKGGRPRGGGALP